MSPNRSTHRGAAAPLVATALALGAALTTPAPARSCRQGPEAGGGAAARRLEAAEQEALGWLRRLRGAGASGDAAGPLAPAEEHELVRRIVALPRSSWLPWIDQLVEASPGHPDRLLAVRLLGAGGKASDIARMVHLAESEEIDGLLSRSFAPVFEAALAELLTLEPSARAGLRSAALNAPLAVRRSMASSLAQLEPRAALEELTALLGFDADLDPTLLTQIARVARAMPKPVEGSIAWLVRARLTDGAPQVVAAAAGALGALEDLDSLDLLLALLEHPEGAVRQGAHRALQTISGVSLPAEPARWRLWVSEEQAWYAEHAADLLAQLTSSNRMTLAQALSEIVLHRLHRRELAPDVVALLQRQEPGVRSLACQILAQLGVEETVPPLIAALEDDDDGVARAAWEALRAITGRDLPPELDAWWSWHTAADPDPGREASVGGWVKASARTRR